MWVQSLIKWHPSHCSTVKNTTFYWSRLNGTRLYVVSILNATGTRPQYRAVRIFLITPCFMEILFLPVPRTARKAVEHFPHHYDDVIIGAMASQITSLTILFSQPFIQTQIKKKHQSSASLAFVRWIHRGPVNSQHKWPATRKCLHLLTSSWSPCNK